jgi:hypothetical protein
LLDPRDRRGWLTVDVAEARYGGPISSIAVPSTGRAPLDDEERHDRQLGRVGPGETALSRRSILVGAVNAVVQTTGIGMASSIATVTAYAKGVRDIRVVGASTARSAIMILTRPESTRLLKSHPARRRTAGSDLRPWRGQVEALERMPDMSSEHINVQLSSLPARRIAAATWPSRINQLQIESPA